MQEKSIEKDEEILNNIKAYMQENIDKGYHKFVYNDLGYDEKCVDVINAIEHILSDYKRVLKENEILKEEKEQAWEERNKLEQGSYETELKLKEENRELKAEMKDGVIAIKLYALQTENEKLKNKIEHYQKLQHNYIEKYDEINEGLQAMISALQELLESEE